MTPKQRIAHALQKLAIAERMVREARREVREACRAVHGADRPENRTPQTGRAPATQACGGEELRSVGSQEA